MSKFRPTLFVLYSKQTKNKIFRTFLMYMFITPCHIRTCFHVLNYEINRIRYITLLILRTLLEPKIYHKILIGVARSDPSDRIQKRHKRTSNLFSYLLVHVHLFFSASLIFVFPYFNSSFHFIFILFSFPHFLLSLLSFLPFSFLNFQSFIFFS